ncbi:MAG: nucleotidyltransferase domain-containing protein [Acidimicrobiales bacterium]|nr:nucleotidyltransferase domain-containing protein [Acidimicrobiales bacterium]
MTSAADAAERLVAAAESGELDAICQARGVRLLGLFGSAARPAGGPPPNDVDVAVSWDGLPDELGLLDDLVVLSGFDGIDLAVIDRADPLLRANAMVGKALFESEPGGYAVTQMAALAEERDTRWLRDLDLEALRRS